MATISAFSSIVLVFFFAFPLAGGQIQRDGLIRSVCNETRAPEQCLSSALVDPHTVNVGGYPKLGKILVGLTLNRAGQTKIKIGHYVRAMKHDPVRYSLAIHCETLYAQVLDSLLTYHGLIASRQYGPLSKGSDRIREKVNACDAPYEVNSPFKSDNVALLVFLDAIFAISKRLIGLKNKLSNFI